MMRFNQTMIILENDHSMIETPRLKNVVIFFQTVLSLVLSRKIIYILYYCSSFTVAFENSEGIRNLETLIARVACLKNTSSPQYFNLKSGKRPQVSTLVAFVVSLKI